ncbi:hypothetical protein [Caenispirillum bisanense]|uniref:Uncharacterized protein n=1 Tax=Caenispirillum bisanense TaxID=414052 RepID=A0A286G1P6_9PROT|nr:hypothetical protein [Caenispirillum bisanense]SOD89099.1 hypothetical protein SAMN05421508_101113 [Caenispirillum bisanense]
MLNPDATCGTCVYWAEQVLQCRNQPPTMDHGWPLSAEDDWCGCWEKKGFVDPPDDDDTPPLPGGPTGPVASRTRALATSFRDVLPGVAAEQINRVLEKVVELIPQIFMETDRPIALARADGRVQLSTSSVDISLVRSATVDVGGPARTAAGGQGRRRALRSRSAGTPEPS